MSNVRSLSVFMSKHTVTISKRRLYPSIVCNAFAIEIICDGHAYEYHLLQL